MAWRSREGTVGGGPISIPKHRARVDDWRNSKKGERESENLRPGEEAAHWPTDTPTDTD